MNFDHMVTNLGLLFFATASALFLQTFHRGPRQVGFTRLAIGAFVIGTLSTTYGVAALGIQSGWNHTSGLLLAASLGWLTIAAYGLFKIKPLGAFVAPLATLILMIQFFAVPYASTAPVQSSSTTILAVFHITMAVFGQAFAIGACAVSIFYLWQRTALKKRQLDQLATQVPAMDRLERILTACLWAGFIFITLGLLSGAFYVQLYDVPSERRLEAKVIWAIAVWLWYLATLIARNIFNHPGRRIAQMSLVGFMLMAMAYFGMIFFRPFGSF